MISEMDRMNRTCKFSFRVEEDEDKRTVAEITDPLIQLPNNPYSEAFSEQRWLVLLQRL